MDCHNFVRRAVESVARGQVVVGKIDRGLVPSQGRHEPAAPTLGQTGQPAVHLAQCLALLGGDVHYYVPSRLEEGYGLNDEALTKLAGEGAQLVITVDCGIASVSQAQHAKDIGLPLIITDHHEFADELEKAGYATDPGYGAKIKEIIDQLQGMLAE